jgi:hypothetical protein
LNHDPELFFGETVALLENHRAPVTHDDGLRKIGKETIMLDDEFEMGLPDDELAEDARESARDEITNNPESFLFTDWADI